MSRVHAWRAKETADPIAEILRQCYFYPPKTTHKRTCLVIGREARPLPISPISRQVDNGSFRDHRTHRNNGMHES
ncbi:hypothetical protein GW17_00034785 [Ensete ventricosum]|nr:hypothetical protein GW17_00034785 [Ensete ventricosum]